MMAGLRALLPDRLAARIALLLAVALIAANLVALALLSIDRKRADNDGEDARGVERALALVTALEAVAPEAWPAIARDASNRLADVRLLTAPLIPATGTDRRSRDIAAQISSALPQRAVFVAGDGAANVRRERGGASGIIIAIALKPVPASSGPLWLNIVAADGGGRGRGGLPVEVFLIVLGLSLVSALGVGLYFTRQLTRPLAALADAARSAGQGDRSIRVAVEGAREMRDAAAAFNAMQGEIARFDAERMRTLAAVGHDLRTPITSLRIRAEMLDDVETRNAMVRTLDEMGVMADGLVAYAKGSRDTEERRRMDLGNFLERLCADRGASLSIGNQAVIMGRPVALSRAIGNLVDNALRYGGMAQVSLRREGSQAVITVDNDGPGIPAERLETMFEPFVRGEDSRNLETGGAGLGLSICRAIILAHGGTVSLANRTPKGLSASVRLPAV
jgi:signal transduction histidine kinase